MSVSIDRIDQELEKALEQEKKLIEDQGFEGYESNEDIPFVELCERSQRGKNGWTILRDFIYIDEKKSILRELKNQMVILAESKNENELEKARNQMAIILSDSRYIKGT